jgi:hypothetical protein
MKINKQKAFSDDNSINISILDNAPENLRSHYLKFLSMFQNGTEKIFSYFEEKDDYGWDYNNDDSMTMGLFIEWAKNNVADLEISKLKVKKLFRESRFNFKRKDNNKGEKNV